MTSAYSVAYDTARAQYCVRRADGLRVFPMPQVRDPDARKRAEVLAETLNRMERDEANDRLRLRGVDIPPDYCAECDLAVYAIEGPRSLSCPECGAQVAEGSAI